MRFLTTTALLFLTSSLTISALPTGTSSSLATRQDDLTSRALEAYEAAEEAEEEAADIKFLLARDLELSKVNEDALAAAAAAAEESEFGKRSPLEDFEKLEEEEDEEEANDIRFLEARDAALAEERKRATKLQPFELEEEKEDLAAADAEEEKDDKKKRATKLQPFELEEEKEDLAAADKEEEAAEEKRDIAFLEARDQSANELEAARIAAEIEEEEFDGYNA